jgi:putative restriction endonuclease
VKSTGKRWSEEETKLALYLYFQLPFGQLHSGNSEIQKLAGLLDRSNSSVAMKLCNFASLDPKITDTGRKGLQGASAQDRRVWADFAADWTRNVIESERAWQAADVSKEELTLKDNVIPFSHEAYDSRSEAEATIQRRVGQEFFRSAVLANFGNQCCITGIAEKALLNASHIIPWAIDVKNRHNPSNGLCLSATLDRAFDRGLIALDKSQSVLVSGILLNHASLETRSYFAMYQGRKISPTSRFEPDPNFLDWHLQEVFVGAG